MEPNENRPIENLLEGLNQHARLLSREERMEELRDRGIDVDSFLTEAHSIISEHLKSDRLAWMKTAEERRQSLASSEEAFDSWIGKGESLIVAAFQSLLESAAPQQTLAFRNKTNLTLDDMARILDDYERLRKKPKSPDSSDQK